MITPGLGRYEVVLDNQWFLRELTQSITMEESLDEIAYRAVIKIVATSDFPGIRNGQPIRVSGIPFDGKEMAYLLHPAVVWDIQSLNRGVKHITVTAYDLTIYLAKSDDERLFPAGQTASQRLSVYAEEWGIPLGQVADTGIPLARALYRPQSIWSMIQKDLQETVAKGGELFRPRMTPDGLSLIPIGANDVIWVLEAEQNIEELGQHRTLEGAVTRVKVLGTKRGSPEVQINTSGMSLQDIAKLSTGEGKQQEMPSPVLAVVDGDTATYGTIQKVLQDSKIKSIADAQTAGEQVITKTGFIEMFTVRGIDINTIRAGDRVMLNSMELIVCSLQRECGTLGHLTLELASRDEIRRRYFARPI
ncbi:phage portal protein [Heliobacillus mobilis]|uniref:Phage portal protein n=1 Tax=Heliobacterium mobile TaxID=28064 RepID=A0A6I3SBF9_HELMO|nr:phage portal protein [Heliobacterium mobile]MTV47767.1 phage portal protein [Heliobacterium mobile]